MNFSLIVPCYNEEGNINAFFEQAEKVLESSKISYEYIFVNDGSTDKTEFQLKKLFDSSTSKNITVVNLSRNFGKEAAIFAGLQHASGDAICIIDADLQQQPQTALEMYKALTANSELDCVCAYQVNRKEKPFTRCCKALFYKTMNMATKTEIKNGASDFRVFTSRVKDTILSLGEYHRFSKGIFSWVGFNTEYVQYEANERNSGKTKWSFSKLAKYGIGGIIDFSTAPLKASIYIGSVATIFSIIYLIVTLVRKLTSNIQVDGFAQLVILISFFSGILLTTVGIIGEYIGRIYEQVKNRPIYITKDVLKKKQLDESFSSRVKTNQALDPYFSDAVEVVFKNSVASATILQQELNIGYSRCCRIVEQMEICGIVGPSRGAEGREIFITKEEWDTRK